MKRTCLLMVLASIVVVIVNNIPYILMGEDNGEVMHKKCSV